MPWGMAEGDDRPRRRKDSPEFAERVKDWNELLDAERTRTTIVNTPHEKWSENFTTTKDEILASVDTRIAELRRKLGLAE
jgi:hypothetical protein